MEDKEKSNKGVLSLSRKNMEISIAEASMFPGFRFSPTDEELICHYLKKKLEGSDKCVEVIPEVDICADEPWDLPGFFFYFLYLTETLICLYIYIYVYMNGEKE